VGLLLCDKFNCILSPEACIKRQKINLEDDKIKEYRNSLNQCKNCRQGVAVINNPNGFIRRDYLRIKRIEESKIITPTPFNPIIIETIKPIIFKPRKTNGKEVIRLRIDKLFRTQRNRSRNKQDFLTPIRIRTTNKFGYRQNRILADR
jgi:hypothetical protein